MAATETVGVENFHFTRSEVKEGKDILSVDEGR